MSIVSYLFPDSEQRGDIFRAFFIARQAFFIARHVLMVSRGDRPHNYWFIPNVIRHCGETQIHTRTHSGISHVVISIDGFLVWSDLVDEWPRSNQRYSRQQFKVYDIDIHIRTHACALIQVLPIKVKEALLLVKVHNVTITSAVTSGGGQSETNSWRDGDVGRLGRSGGGIDGRG